MIPETKLHVGPLELDLIERTAKRGDRSIDLRPREFRLLEYMMRRKELVLTREKLLREVWRYKVAPKSNLVDVHMGRLRRKIDGPHDSPMILNVRRKGFILRVGQTCDETIEMSEMAMRHSALPRAELDPFAAGKHETRRRRSDAVRRHS
jgi:DNA-binding winged helix-turn-helix (wHTH) protein